MTRKFILNTLGNFLMILGLGIAIFAYVPIIYSEIKYAFSSKDNVVPVQSEHISDSDSIAPDDSDFENIALLEPVNPEFSVVITKIDVNAPIIQDVTTVNQKEYMDALKRGVAHARGTALPGEKGNMFLFAHSSLNFWQLGPYATVFNLLNKLEKGDLVTIFYEDRAYTYQVYEMEVVPGWNTEPFYEESDDATLTLVTCDPPGSTLNRRIVKARLI
jgi:LPXTG-site transpeptidase (sortase) family protein